MAFATILQAQPGGNGSGTTAVTCTLSAATAGNLLVYIRAGDKNTGTLAMSDNISGSTGWTVEVSFPSASVSLYIAYKTAVGGETTITGTTSAASTTGATAYAAELQDTTSTAAWAVVAKGTNPTSEATALTWSTGTSGAATYDGLAFAAVAVDSQNTQTGTATWSNGYTTRNTPVAPAGTGGGNAGIYVASNTVAAGATTTSTYTNTGTADQLSGAVVAFGRQTASGPTAPTVNAGVDASVAVNSTFSRTATENNNGATITSRTWTIQSGPSGVGTTIGTAAALSWTPTVSGTYTLRYSATNSAGTGFDDVVVTVSAPTRTHTESWVGLDALVVKTSSSASGEQARIAFSSSVSMTSPVYSGSLVTPDANGVSKHAIPALVPGADYYYQVELGGALIGSPQLFQVIPGTSPQNFSFAFSSCRHHSNNAPSPNPTAFTNAKGRGIDLFLEIGDFHYRDITSNNQSLFHAGYDELYTRSNIADVLKSVPTVYTWDDHDTGGDNTDGTDVALPAAQAVYRNRVPHTTLPHASGIYHTFVIGRVRFIVLDCRSFRSPNGNTDNSSKTMLGATQKTWLQNLLDTATTPYTVIVSSVGWVGGAEPAQDHWGNYSTERTEIGGWITANAAKTKVVFISGDAHMLALDNGTSAVAGTPQYHGGALNQTGSTKGGPYSGGTLAGSNQFGLIEVTDDGSTIALTYSGIRSDNTVWNTHSTSVFAPPAGSGPEGGRFLLAY